LVLGEHCLSASEKDSRSRTATAVRERERELGEKSIESIMEGKQRKKRKNERTKKTGTEGNHDKELEHQKRDFTWR